MADHVQHSTTGEFQQSLLTHVSLLAHDAFADSAPAAVGVHVGFVYVVTLQHLVLVLLSKDGTDGVWVHPEHNSMHSSCGCEVLWLLYPAALESDPTHYDGTQTHRLQTCSSTIFA
jgi:hypothetical protein